MNKPVVVSSFEDPDDGPDDDPGGGGDQDCACPMPRPCATRELNEIDWDAPMWVRQKDVIEIPLDPNYGILFNPLGQGGVTVVDNSAHKILKSFSDPRPRPKGSDDSALLEQAVFQKLARREFIHPIGTSAKPRFRPSEVLTVWLHTTDRCTMSCPMCYLRKVGKHMTRLVGIATIDSVFNSAVAHGYKHLKLKYAGGEATLNSKVILDMHDHAVQLSKSTGVMLSSVLLSNGLALSTRLIEALKERGIRVMLSLDGIGKYQDEMRPIVGSTASSSKAVLRSIDNLIEAGVRPHLSITLSGRNLDGVPDVVQFALDHALTFNLNFFRDNQFADGVSDLKYAESKMIATVLRCFAIIDEFTPDWSPLTSILDLGQLIEPRQTPCGVGADYIVVSETGQVASCHMHIEKTLGSIFTSDPLSLVRASATELKNRPVDEKIGCRSCSWKYWCAGGCPALTLKVTGRTDIKSPNCKIYKAIFPEAIKLEAKRLLRRARTKAVLAD